jgi:hypothetical protein
MNNILRFFALVVMLFSVGCNQCKPMDVKVTPPPPPVKVILVTIDGTRWQDVFDGTDSTLYHGTPISSRDLMPNLYHYFVDQGMVVGRKSLMVASNSSHVSLPGYLEIMRGYQTFDCTNNKCDPYLTPTIADYFDQVAVFSSWDTIRKAVSQHSYSMVVNCGRRYRSDGWLDKNLTDNQFFDASDFSYDPLYRLDEYTRKVALDYFTQNHPDFLWVALGDTDEWAHMNQYTRYLQAMQSADTFLGDLMKDPESQRYLIVVTVDHGRGSNWNSHGSDAESARVWLMMRGPNVPAGYEASYNATVSLANILPTIIGLVRHETFSNSLLFNIKK